MLVLCSQNLVCFSPLLQHWCLVVRVCVCVCVCVCAHVCVKCCVLYTCMYSYVLHACVYVSKRELK